MYSLLSGVHYTLSLVTLLYSLSKYKVFDIFLYRYIYKSKMSSYLLLDSDCTVFDDRSRCWWVEGSLLAFACFCLLLLCAQVSLLLLYSLFCFAGAPSRSTRTTRTSRRSRTQWAGNPTAPPNCASPGSSCEDARHKDIVPPSLSLCWCSAHLDKWSVFLFLRGSCWWYPTLIVVMCNRGALLNDNPSGLPHIYSFYTSVMWSFFLSCERSE